MYGLPVVVTIYPPAQLPDMKLFSFTTSAALEGGAALGNSTVFVVETFTFGPQPPF